MNGVSEGDRVKALNSASAVQDVLDRRENALQGKNRDLLKTIADLEHREPGLVGDVAGKYPYVQSLVNLVSNQDGKAADGGDKPADASPAKPPKPKPAPMPSGRNMWTAQGEAEEAHDLLKTGDDFGSRSLAEEIGARERLEPAVKDWVASHYPDVQKLVDEVSAKDAG